MEKQVEPLTPYPIRPLQDADLPLAQEIRTLAGWNQSDADWRRLLELEPQGCFAINCDGRLAGTATTALFDDRMAWIGMILVHPKYRRRGLATKLIRHCLDYLLEVRNVDCVKLDATPEGEQVYSRLGFQKEYELFRWQGNRTVAARAATESGFAEREAMVPSMTIPHTTVPENIDRAVVTPIDPGDPEPWLSIDRSAFGVDRSLLLKRLSVESQRAVVLRIPGRRQGLGFGMLREGAAADYLGPVSASDEESGRRIVCDLTTASGGAEPSRGGGALPGSETRGLSVHHSRGVFWDLPEPNRPAQRLATALGFTRQRPLVRMWTGRSLIAGDVSQQWAISGPETG